MPRSASPPSRALAADAAAEDARRPHAAAAAAAAAADAAAAAAAKGSRVGGGPGRLAPGPRHRLFHRPLRALPRKREVVRSLTPSWFTVVMGTGSVALTIAVFPYPFGAAQRAAALAAWALSTLLFLLVASLFCARLAFFPETVAPMAHHPAQSLFLGAIPMAFCTLLNGVVLVLAPYLAPSALPSAASAALALYWANVPAVGLSVLLVPFFMFTTHGHSHERVTAIYLLPVVPACVQAGSAGTIAAAFAPQFSPRALESLLLSGYAFVGVGLLLSILVSTLYFQRLLYHHLPPKEVIVSSFLPLGPYAMSSLAFVRLGAAAETMLRAAYAAVPPAGGGGGGSGGQAPATAAAGDLVPLAPLSAGALPARDASALPRYVAMLRSADGAGLVLALALWGFALWWLAVAVACVGSAWRTLAACGLGLWGGIFPLGVLVLNTAALAQALDVPALRGIAAALAACHWAFWLYVAAITARGAWSGALFVAPCLVDLERARRQAEPAQQRSPGDDGKAEQGEEEEEEDDDDGDGDGGDGGAAEEGAKAAAASARAAARAAQAAAAAAEAAALEAEAAAAAARGPIRRSSGSARRKGAAAGEGARSPDLQQV
jgi:tellurite resistance protein TehA-like permease